MPADALLQAWLDMIAQTPVLLPVWLILENDQHIVAHWIASADMYYGRPFVHVHQLVIDHPRITRQFKNEAVNQFVGWIHHMNQTLAESESPARFEAIRLLTRRSAAVWQRWFPLDLVLEERTLTFAVPAVKPEPDEC